MNSAELCRQNNWGVGTRLIGNEGRGDTIIEITAIGECAILARMISHTGTPPGSWLFKGEASWTLEYRDWRKVLHDAEATTEIDNTRRK